jgi:hypothetical protein
MHAVLGFPFLLLAGSRSLTGIRTGPAGVRVTNWVSAAWGTMSGEELIGLCRKTLVRSRVWDGLFWSASLTSGPFVVDNNMLLSRIPLQDRSEGGAYAHNLIAGCQGAGAPTCNPIDEQGQIHARTA